MTQVIQRVTVTLHQVSDLRLDKLLRGCVRKRVGRNYVDQQSQTVMFQVHQNSLCLDQKQRLLLNGRLSNQTIELSNSDAIKKKKKKENI